MLSVSICCLCSKDNRQSKGFPRATSSLFFVQSLLMKQKENQKKSWKKWWEKKREEQGRNSPEAREGSPSSIMGLTKDADD